MKGGGRAVGEELFRAKQWRVSTNSKLPSSRVQEVGRGLGAFRTRSLALGSFERERDRGERRTAGERGWWWW